MLHAVFWREVPKRQKLKTGRRKERELKYGDYYEKPSFVYGLYVGFETTTPGNIRVAVKTDKGIKVISTSKYKGVSEGGGIDINQQVQNATDTMIMDRVEVQLSSNESVVVEELT
jgi:hypothetical protein